MSIAELKNRQATLATKFVTVPISRSSLGDGTSVRAIQPGQLFLVYGFWLKSAGVVDVIWKSGSTALTGTIPLSIGETVQIFQEVPVLKGRASGDDLILNLSGNVSVQGWVNLTEASF